jgi:phosphoribosylamine--glycine ligase
MNILVLGGGGREHAIIKALKKSKQVKTLSCAPGNPGIGQIASCLLTDPDNPQKVLEVAKRLKPDLVVIGPEAPLAKGVSDALRIHDFLVFGPSQKASQLETSKVFSKEFLEKHNIPTAKYVVCENAEAVFAAALNFSAPWVIKADGLAAGKGVRICRDEGELKKCVSDFFEKKSLGKAAQRVLVEEFIDGEEISLMLLIAGGKYQLLPISRDHKRLLDNNEGPNTGGMGAFAPVKQTEKFLKVLEDIIVKPTIAGLAKDQIDYRGVLYIGVMIKDGKPYVLEFNCRFGDPEAQVLLPLLDGDWAQVFKDVAGGKMPKLKWKSESAVCVVVASPGYPESPQKSLRITIDTDISKNEVDHYLLHASTMSHNGYLTNGGRVLSAVGIDKTLAGARKKAYKILAGVEFEGMHYRKDIAEIKKG